VAGAVALAVAAVLALVWPRSDALPNPAGAGPALDSAVQAVPSPQPTARPIDLTRRPVTEPGAGRWLRVLNRLDDQRATAFARGDPHLLEAVYAARSAALDADRATLAAYRSRGLRLIGVRMQVLALRVVSTSQRRVVLHVVDRLDRVSAVDGAGLRTVLPADRPSAHRMVLAQRAGGWRVAAVGPAAGLSRGG
jgi:hypothetical protein